MISSDKSRSSIDDFDSYGGLKSQFEANNSQETAKLVEEEKSPFSWNAKRRVKWVLCFMFNCKDIKHLQDNVEVQYQEAPVDQGQVERVNTIFYFDKVFYQSSKQS